MDVNENKVVAPKASVQEEKAVVRDSALRGAFVELRSNTPEALSTNGTQSEDASNWQSLANALNNGNVGTINITQDIIINGRVNGVTDNNNYLYLDSQGSAREVTINGNGHKIEFGQYSIAVQNKNYQNTDSAWKITVKNTRIIASESKYSPISFYGSAENTKKSQLVFDGVDANLDNRTLVDEYGKNLPVVFKGENRIWVTSMPMGYNTVTSLTTVVDSGITAFKVHGDIANKSGSAINANNWILWSKDTGENSTVINEGATLSLQVLSDDIRGVQTGNQLVAGQPNYGSMVVNGTLDAKMAKGHSSAISTQNLTIGSQGIVTIHTQQDNQADGKEDSTTNAVTNYNGFHYAPVNIFGGFITSVAFPASTQKGYLTNNGNLTIIRDNSDKTLTPLISFGAGGINKNMDMKLYVGPGASLDLQDNSDTYVQGNNTNSPFSGMISMWGTSSTNSLEFNNPAYVNLQRTGDLRGSLIRLEGVQNNAWVNGPDANSAVTPIAQWDQGNMSDSPSNTWYVDQLHIQNEWGNNFDQYIPKGKVPQVGISHKGVDTLYDSNASVKMAENQAGVGSTEYNDGTFNSGSGVSYQTPYLNKLLNNFNWWKAQRIAMGSSLAEVVNISDADKYQPVVKTINGNTGQTLGNLAAKDGIEGLRTSDGNVTSDLLPIKNVTWYDPTTDGTLWNEVMGGLDAPNNPTGNLKTTDTSAWAKVTYTDGSADFANIPLHIAAPMADTNQPHYDPISVEQGKTATDNPSFTSQDGKPATAPTDTTFTTGTDTPDWATVDPSTGIITVKPGNDVTPGAYNVPVTVTYPDMSTDETTVPVIVTKAGQEVIWGDNGVVVTTVDTSKLNAHETTENSQVLSPATVVTAEGYELTDGKLLTTATPIIIDPLTVSWTTTPDTTVDTATAAGKEVTASVTVDLTNNDAAKNILGSKNGVVTTNPFTIDAKGAGAKNVTNPVTVALGSDLTSEQFSQLVDNNIPTDEIASTTWATKPDAKGQGGVIKITFTDKDANGNPTYLNVNVPSSSIKITADADDHNPEGQDVNTKTGVVPDPAEGIKNKSDLPDGTKYTWKDTPDVTKPGESTGVIVVTYPDGSKDEVPVTIHVTNPTTPTDADKYTPEGQDVNTKTGVVPDPAEGIKNKSDLPDGTKYTWKDTPDVTKPGESTGVIVVTYPDGSKDEVPVIIHVTTPTTPTDADKYTPEGQDVNTKTGVVPNPAEGIKNKSDLPDGTKYTWKDTPDVTTAGDKPATVVVTYPDGSKDEVPVTIHVTNPTTPTDADKYTPEGQDVNTKTGVVPNPAEGIKNKGDLPDGTKYTWKDTPDVTTAGDKPATVVVTYPDGSKDEVPVIIHVTTPTTPTDADKYTPEGQDVNTKTGVVPNPAEGIKNKSDLPDGTKYTWKDTPDVTTAGDKPATVVVTYPDGSKDEVPVIIHVTTPTTPTDADKYTPEGQDVNTKTGVVPNPAEGIKNKGDLPDGTKYTWKDTPDVTTEGNKPAVVVVTYPDGSKDEVPVTIHVTTPTTPTDADKYTPEGQDVNTKPGVVPNPAEGIKNKGDLPDGTKYTWKDTPDVTKPGESTGVIVVTYPDGSKDEVPVTIHVTTPTTPTDADKYTPKGQDVNTKTGVVPNPAEGIKNKGDLPDGTKYTWKDTPDVTTEGNKPAVVVVTYPDGSKDEVPVTIHVTNPTTPTDADKYTPEGQDVTTKTGVVPDPAEGIKNKSDLPDGTKYTWKDTPDVTKPGESTGVIVVTYPDGSKDEVPVTIHVTNPATPTDADKYTPEGQDVNTKTGVVPDPAEGIKNKSDLPDGTKYTWEKTPDVTKPGESTGVIVVTYPDGSKDEVPVTIHVTNPATPTDADKYTPEGQDVNTKTGVVPDPAEGIKNKSDLPDGTKYTWEKTPDVTKPGESTGVIVVTYPDGSKDEVTVKVIVNTNNVTPETQPIHTTPGVLPNPADAIKNKDEMPAGTKYTWKEVPNVNTVGEHTGVITVTYPDGSSVDLTVKVYVDAVAKENNSNNTAQVITKHVAETTEKHAPTTPAQQIKHTEKATLPQTGAKSENAAGVLGLAIAAVSSLFGLGASKKRRDQ
ncbi:Rib/alpha-like domain-containing protein [Lactobacillus johnsonii]